MGLYQGGPEEIRFRYAWREIAMELSKYTGELDDWDGKIPAMNLVFYVAGSVSQHEHLKGIEAARFSRKNQMLLVTSLVPADVLQDMTKARKFIFDAIREASKIASDVFAKKMKTCFSVERVEQYLQLTEKGIESKPTTYGPNTGT